jgi:putative membrane protein
VFEFVPLLLSGLTLAAYLVGANRLHRRGDRWPVARVWCMVGGTVCVAAAAVPPLGSHDELFPVHVSQHLLVAMIGPALFALSGPVTLALRTVPTGTRGALLHVLHSRPLTVIASPAVALVLDVGGLYTLYLTGMYGALESHELLHAAVHLHMFLAGCLLSWVVIGIDPIRRRSTAVKLVTLTLAAAAHDTLAKLMYAHDLPAGGGPILERHIGTEIMYYGGTVMELVLAAVVMTQWWRATGRSLANAARRTESPTA